MDLKFLWFCELFGVLVVGWLYGFDGVSNTKKGCKLNSQPFGFYSKCYLHPVFSSQSHRTEAEQARKRKDKDK